MYGVWVCRLRKSEIILIKLLFSFFTLLLIYFTYFLFFVLFYLVPFCSNFNFNINFKIIL